MPQNFRVVAGKNKKGRNKQGAHSQPLDAWKRIAELEYEDALQHGAQPYKRPRAATRPLTPTGRPRKRINTQAREQRNQTRRRNKEQRTAEEEHERRSKAARLGWSRQTPEQRSARADKGWDTKRSKSRTKNTGRYVNGKWYSF